MSAPPPARSSLSEPSLADWREDAAYLPLIGADPSAFAWEWLRRTAAYRAIWNGDGETRETKGAARQFGLEALEDPAVTVPHARPVWSRLILPDVLTAHVEVTAAPLAERIDLRLLAPLVTIVIGHEETEHLLFSDGRRFLRVDVIEGTLIGCPSSLTYLLRAHTLERTDRIAQPACPFGPHRKIRGRASFACHAAPPLDTGTAGRGCACEPV